MNRPVKMMARPAPTAVVCEHTADIVLVRLARHSIVSLEPCPPWPHGRTYFSRFSFRKGRPDAV